MNRMLIGSQYFFNCYEGFEGRDLDELEIIETDNFRHCRQISGQRRCLFQFKKYDSKEVYIKYALRSKTGMVLGKFLVPEFCNAIGFTIEDLPRLEPLLAKLDEKHKYEEIIYNAYIENNAFVLTDEQRAAAYESYKVSRGAE